MRLDSVLEGLARGDTAALSRAISLIENHREGFESVLSELHKKIGKGGTHRIGITGPPGAGKSTLTEQLVRAYRERGLKVAVIAVDPTSHHVFFPLLAGPAGTPVLRIMTPAGLR